MFCFNCGSHIQDGMRFCSSCGTPVPEESQSAYDEPQYDEPQYQEPEYEAHQNEPAPEYYAPVSAMRGTSRDHSGVRTKGALVLVTMVLALVLIAAGVFLLQNTSFLEIPFVAMVTEVAEIDELEELPDELEALYDELEEDYEYEKEFLTDEQAEILEALLDSVKDLTRTPSLNNMMQVVQVYDACADQLEDEFDIDEEELDSIRTAAAVMKFAPLALWAAFFLPLLFTLLGGLLKSTGLSVTAAVFAFLSQLPVCNIAVTAATLVVLIVQAVFCSQVKKARRANLYGTAA